MKKSITVLIILILLLLTLVACSSRNMVEEYAQMCKTNNFTNENLKDIVLNLNNFDWKKYSASYQENEYVVDIFWKLKEYQFDEKTLIIVLKLRETNSKGLDGALAEGYLALVEYLYESDKYKDIILKLEIEDPVIAKTIKMYKEGYGQ